EADAVPVRQEVNDPNHVPDAGLEERHRLAAIADRAQAEHLLADRLSGPEGHARPEIAEDDDEPAEHPDKTDEQRPARHARAAHLNALTPAQVLTMAQLYRRATADLARAQRDWPGEPVHRYLNGLVARGHGIVYRRGGNVLKRIRTFYVETLPRTYRQAWPYLLAAGALMFVPAFITFFAVLVHPQAAYPIAHPPLIDQARHP